MKTPAIIVAFTIVGSLAYAAGQARVVPPQSPDQPSLPPMSGGKQGGSGGEGGVATQVGSSQCGGVEITINWENYYNWFSSTPNLLPDCDADLWGNRMLRGQPPVDVNGDGMKDRLVPMRLLNFPLYTPTDWIGYGGDDCCIGDFFLCRVQTTVAGDSTFVTYQPVFRSDMMWQLMERVEQSCNSVSCGVRAVSFVALEDMDGDTDLDLVFRYEVLLGNGGQSYTSVFRYGWLANTAVANPPLTGDINGDGRVDGKDLAFVLSAWTP